MRAPQQTSTTPTGRASSLGWRTGSSASCWPAPLAPLTARLASIGRARGVKPPADRTNRQTCKQRTTHPGQGWGTKRHRERLHRYDVPVAITLTDLLHTRIGEGFRLIDSSTAEPPWQQDDGGSVHGGGGGGGSVHGGGGGSVHGGGGGSVHGGRVAEGEDVRGE